MAIKKIPCGGWLYDDESITFEDGVMKVIGGSSGGMLVANLSYDEETDSYSCDKTYDELVAAVPNVVVIEDGVYPYNFEQINIVDGQRASIIFSHVAYVYTDSAEIEIPITEILVDQISIDTNQEVTLHTLVASWS